MPSFTLSVLGCKVNRADAEELRGALLLSGWEEAEGGPADVGIVFTCTVTAEADRKSRQALRRSAGSAARVLACGCCARLDPEAVRSVEGVWASAASNAEAARLLGIDPPGSALWERRPAQSLSRAFLKIQDGCPGSCGYCRVRLARGRPWSMPLEEVRRRAGELALAGHREVVLVGVDLASYGAEEGVDLADAVVAAAESGPARVRLSSLEPGRLTPRHLERLALVGPALCPSFHVPLQSGDDEVLRRMGRPYTASGFLRLVGEIRRLFPHAFLSTDVICGFPGESAGAFARTLDVCREAGFARIHPFRYSPRPGTPAASLPDEVPPAEKRRRVALAHGLGKELFAAYLARTGTRPRQLLIERVLEAGDEGMLRFVGHTEDYVEAVVSARALVGDIVDVMLVGVLEGYRARAVRV